MRRAERAGVKTPTGVPVLDEMLKGGLSSGTSTLLWCAPFVDGTIFLYQLCHSWLSKGMNVVYLVNNKRPEVVYEDAERYGWNLRKYGEENRFILVDAYTGLMGIESDQKYAVSDPSDINDVSGVLVTALKEVGGQGTLVAIDSLSNMLDSWSIETLECMKEWNRWAILKDLFIVYLFNEWDYEEEIKKGISDLCDNVVALQVIERNIITGDVFTVRKVDGKPVEARPIPFKYLRPGGLKVYIPKILITGPYNAGKTTVVHALSSRAVSVERRGTTVALDFGHLDYKGFTAELFGTIGQQRFDPILEQLGGESLGVILVVDSTKPETFPRAFEMLRKARVYGLPLVVFANKQDLPGALSPEEVRERMHLPPDVPVIGTVATEKRNIYEGLETLLKLIFKVG